MVDRSQLAFFSIFALSLTVSCADRARNLPVYDKVPAFGMTDSEGKQFDGSQLRGKVWIADVIYTNCPAECPRMTSEMHRLSEQLASDGDVKLMSVSVDPARDTPAVLNAFAHRYNAPTAQWIFLTGSPATIHLIAYQTFHVGDVLGRIEHSTKFILVDKQSSIRGYYSAFDPEAMTAIVEDARALERTHF